ncbi:glycosyltransferase family 2 protein [Rubripirellula obstinata]|nr:glycosyltransferase [Rubripirellula obstinata]
MPHRLAPSNVSFVMPVRNRQHDVVQLVEHLLSQLTVAGIGEAEVVVVDDGSHDQTRERLHDLQTTRSRLRVLRHDRPRGMESAGQTGLERATGKIVLICEDEHPVLTEDLRRLLEIAKDETVVAARTESKVRPPSAPLMRRLRSWGTQADTQFESRDAEATEPAVQYSSLQLIRRPHLKTLASPAGHHFQLSSESAKSLSVMT